MFVVDVLLRDPLEDCEECLGDCKLDLYYYEMLRVEIMMWENFLVGLAKGFERASGIDCFVHVMYGRYVAKPGFMIEYVIPEELVDFYPGDFNEILPPGAVCSDLCEEECEGG